MNDPHEILGVAKGATPEQIHAAYKKLVKELHPDKHSDDPHRSQKEERLKKVNAAYTQLKKSFSINADAKTKRKTEEAKRKTAEAAKRRAAQAAKRRAAENAARQSSGEAATGANAGEAAEAAAARFWKAFHKAEQDLKR
jgi:curved DNA-binding protein CbpA